MNILSEEIEVSVKFSEVDSLTIVWHGHYVRYFEDGREAFGLKYDMGYMDIYNHGSTSPIVKVICDYKKPLKYGDIAIVKAQYVDCDAAKLIFKFEIRRKSNLELIATGETIQVLVDQNGDLSLTIPDFVQEWKIRNHLR
jgi:acyl-CoA thioester hydrolase